MKNKLILMICEGPNTEMKITKNIKKVFDFNDNIKFISYKTNIYQLYSKLKKDDFETDLFSVLIEKAKETGTESDIISINQKEIDQIYLFFDYDGQDTSASDEKILEMLKAFNNETEYGKLYISYPMVEAIRDIRDSEQCNRRCCVDAHININYKELSAKDSKYTNITQSILNDWYKFIYHNLHKCNCIINTKFELPEYKKYSTTMNQETLFAKQMERFINAQNKVAVLSAFPLFILDYFGEPLYDEICNNKANLIKYTCKSCLNVEQD